MEVLSNPTFSEVILDSNFCNEALNDKLSPIIRTSKGVVTRYETSAKGSRFQKEILSFSKDGRVQRTENVKLLSLSVDTSVKYQEIIGFGGAFTDAAGICLSKLSDKLQKQIISDYFSSNGIEYSLARVPVAGCDFSERPYSYHEVDQDFELRHFALAREDLIYKVSNHVKMNFGSNYELNSRYHSLKKHRKYVHMN